MSVDRGAPGAIAWRSVAAFVVKLIHSAVFLGISASTLHVFYAGIANRRTRFTRVALAIALGESFVFAANRWRCPLRGLAEELGAESGQVTDIFLPRWFADRIPWIFTPLLAAGTSALLWHRWLSPEARADTSPEARADTESRIAVSNRSSGTRALDRAGA